MISKNAPALTLATLLVSIALPFSSLFMASASADVPYTGSNLMDNQVFLDAGSMGSGQTGINNIQNFLSGKGSFLASYNALLDCSTAILTNQQTVDAYHQAGAPCGQTVSAAAIIYYASQVYGVNPQASLATMQKEQSIVTAPTFDQYKVNYAMGYGCPDSGGCSATPNSNFLYQMDNGDGWLRINYERALGNMTYWFTQTSWVCGTSHLYYSPDLYPGSNVQFRDDNGVLYATYNIANAATSSLYCYTPHAYNNFPGCTNGHYASWLPTVGSSGMCYTGSYNFVSSFYQWFGSMYSNDIGTTVNRLWNPSKRMHFFTARGTERLSAMLTGYSDDGQGVFKVLQTQEPGSIPIYSLYQGAQTDNWLLPDGPNLYWGVVIAGYLNRGVAFYAYPANPNPSPGNPVCQAGTAPVMQMWQPGLTEHFYSTNGGDHSWALLYGGYVDDGSSAYKDANGGVSFCVPQ